MDPVRTAPGHHVTSILRPTRAAAVFVAAFLALPSPASPQSSDAPAVPEPGDRIRIMQGPWIPAGWRSETATHLEGRFRETRGDTLVLELRPEVLVTIPITRAARPEVARPGERHTGQGFLAGAAVGFVVGIFAFGIDGEGDDGPGDETVNPLDPDEWGVGVAGSMVVGGLAGALVGSAYRETLWVPMRRPARVAGFVVPAPDGRWRLGLRVPIADPGR